MQQKWSAFLERNVAVPEVQSALKSVKKLTETKSNFLYRLSFEAEPSDFGKVLSVWNLKKLESEDGDG